MAVKRNESKKEHAYKTFEKALKEDRLANVLLLYGRENYLIDWAVSMIVERYVQSACVDFDYTRFSGTGSTFDDIANCCETLPMFSSKKIVVVDQPKIIETESDEEQRWLDYIAKIPETCLLIITSQRADGRKRVFKAIQALGGVYSFDELDEHFLRKFIEKRMKASGRQITAALADELVARSGYFDKNAEYTLYNLENDIKKIIAHAADHEIRREDIILTMTGSIDRDVFHMLDALGSGRKGSAFRILAHLSLYNESEYRILGLICSQYEAVLLVRELKEDGKSLPEIARALGMHEYRARLMAGLSDKYSLDQLRSILGKAYQVDRSIKSGLLDKNLALELFIASA